MTIKTKLFGAGTLVSLLLFLVLGITVYFFQNLDKGFEDIVSESGNGVVKSQITDKAIGEANKELIELTSKMNEISDAIEKSNMFVKITARKIKNLSGDLNDITETVEETYEELPEGDAKDSLEMVADDISDMQETMKREALIGLDKSVKELQQITIEINTVSNRTQELNQGLSEGKALSNDVMGINTSIQQMSLGFKDVISQNRNILAILIITFALMSLVVGFILAKSITTPLNKAVNFAKEFAKGDLTQQLDIDQNDEIGVMAKSFNEFGQILRDSMGHIVENAVTLASASTELTATSEGMSGNASNINRQLCEISTAGEQLAGSISEMSEISVSTSDSANRVTINISEMSQAVQDVTNNCVRGNEIANRAVEKADDAKRVIQQLNSAAIEIENVVSLIRKIADKTNLLALNATIEAASAGEAGKGFAVVANEVKDLAGQTANATEQITEKIADIRKNTDISVQAIEEIAIVNEEVNQISTTISAAMEEQSVTSEEIRKTMTSVLGQAEETSNKAGEATNAAGQVSINITQVNNASEESTRHAEDTHVAVSELEKMACELQTIVNRFKVE